MEDRQRRGAIDASICPSYISQMNTVSAVIIVGFALLAPSSCVVPPIPLTHRTEAPNGAKVPDLDFIQAGVTTRDQVNQALGELDTGATPGMFWGRYNRSVMSDPGGSRYWSRNNLLITYDELGVVKSQRRVGDDRMNAIVREWLATRPKRSFQADASHQETRIEGTRLSHMFSGATRVAADLVLRDDKFSVVERGPGAKLDLHVSPTQVRRIQTASPDMCCDPKALANRDLIEKIWIDDTVHKKLPLLVEVSPANMVVLVDYFRQYAPRAKYD